MVGDAFTLARWFDEAQDASGPRDDEVREAVLSDVYAALVVAQAEDVVLAKTPKGAVMMTQEDIEGVKLVWFDAVEDERWRRVRFWMNASSVRDLSKHLKTLPQVAFESIFLGAQPEEPRTES
jgi:hypothetical protein